MFWLMALGPVAVLLGWIYCCDKQEKEPLGLLLKCFFFGILSIIPVFWAETYICALFPITSPGMTAAFIGAFPGAAIPEEIAKFFLLYLIIWKHREFNEKFDGIVYAVFISLGFAAVENVMYLCNEIIAEGNFVHVGIQRGLFAIPLHFLCGVLMGYYFSRGKFENRPGLLQVGLWLAILVHGIYDFILFLMVQEGYSSLEGVLFLAFLVANIFFWKAGKKRINHLMAQSAEDARLKTLEDVESTYELDGYTGRDGFDFK